MFDLLKSWIDAGGPLTVGALMALENVFPPIPSELIMPLAGFNAAQGSMSLVLVILVGTAGSVLGCLFWYWLARAWGRELSLQCSNAPLVPKSNKTARNHRFLGRLSDSQGQAQGG